MSRKKNHRMHARIAAPAALATVVWSNQPNTEGEVLRVMNATRAALVRMLEGNGSGSDAARLGRDINVAWVRAEQIGGSQDAQRRLEAAAEAVMQTCSIFKRHGRFGLTGPGRVALGEGVDVFEEIVRASTPREMAAAEDLVVSAERDMRRRTERTT